MSPPAGAAGLLTPSAHDGRRVGAVVLDDARARQPQQPADLFRDPLEHPARRWLGGDERRNPAQGGMLVGQRALPASLTARARAARVRSAVTAASTSEVSAAVAMKNCVASRLSVIESRTNGPSSCAVFHTVIEQTTTIAVAAPRGPRRNAAQSSTGKTM